MAEDHVRLPVAVDIQGAVQAFPVPGGNRSVAVKGEGAFGGVRNHNLGAAAGCLALETDKHIEFAMILMDFWRPEVHVRPKSFRRCEDDRRAAPADQIVAFVDVQPGCLSPGFISSGAVQIVTSPFQ